MLDETAEQEGWRIGQKQKTKRKESEDDSEDKERKDRQMYREMVWKKSGKRSESLWVVALQPYRRDTF